MVHYQRLELSPEEADALRRLAQGNDLALTRRARLILLAAEGLPQASIAAEVKLSERQVRRWQRAFESGRMSVFAPPPAASSAVTRDTKVPAPESKIPLPVPVPVPEPARRTLYLNKHPGVTPDLPMSEAGRKVMHYHFERMLLHEPGSRMGEDIEALHDMRVATRRLRSALVIFEPFYKPKVIRSLARDLRRAGRSLGAVRDLDVFNEKMERYRQTLPERNRDNLAPLLDAWMVRRQTARDNLIAHLDSPNFARFLANFEQFLSTEGAGARSVDPDKPAAYTVRYIVPRLIYERYEAVRAYEAILERAPIETLHACRIDCKQLRYTLEFFAEVLGPEAKTVIEEVKRIQDHLGDLNDAHIAGDQLRDFISDYEQDQSGVPLAERASIEGVVQYMASKFAEKHHLLVTFPDAWKRFTRLDVRRDLALAVSVL